MDKLKNRILAYSSIQKFTYYKKTSGKENEPLVIMFVVSGFSDRNANCNIFVFPKVQNNFNFISHVEFLLEANEHHMITIGYKYKFGVCVYWYHVYSLVAVLKMCYFHYIRRYAGQLICF